MNLNKSHFLFSKEQRNGIFLLIILIIVSQVVYFYSNRTSENLQVKNEELAKFQKEIDSLKRIEIEARKPKIFPFNPNFITDYKGATLGMSNEEIDRLLVFRKQNKWINSSKQFQEVTQISDSLLMAISPYFKFPDWVNSSNSSTDGSSTYNAFKKTSKTFSQKHDLNKATAVQLQEVNGVGVVLSDRIIKYRNKFVGGFIDMVQLQDVYGLSPEVIEKIAEDFAVKTPRDIQKIKLNEATVDVLVTVQHIDYKLARQIVEQRQLRDGYKSLEELKKVKDFPVNKFDIIKLYLSLD